MKLRSFHAVLVVAVFACLVAANGQVSVPPPVSVAAPVGGLHPPARGWTGVPDPNDLVLIRQEDGGYIVPSDRILVLTGFGFANSNQHTGSHGFLSVDGVELMACVWSGGTSGLIQTIQELPPVPIPAGSTVSVNSASPTANTFARATGYLADGRPGHDLAGSVIPEPRDFVLIRESTGYRVPPGKRLVITGLGAQREGYNVELMAFATSGGLDRLAGSYWSSGQHGLDLMLRPVPPFPVDSGQVIPVTGAGDKGLATGYLVDERP